MKKPTIYDIKYWSQSKAPYFFDTHTMKGFGQTMKSFSVYKTDDPRVWGISAPSYMRGFDGRKKVIGITNRFFSVDNLFLEESTAIEYANEKEKRA